MNIIYANTPAEEFNKNFNTLNTKVDTSDFMPFDLAAFEAAKNKPTLYTRSGLPVRLINTAINEVIGASQSRTDKNYNGKCIVGMVYRPTYKKWKLNSWYANGKDATVPGWDLMMKPEAVITYMYSIHYIDCKGVGHTINSYDYFGDFETYHEASNTMLDRCDDLISSGGSIITSEVSRKVTKTI